MRPTAVYRFIDPTPGLWDLTTNTQLLKGAYPGGPQSLADDGTILSGLNNIIRNGQLEYLPLEEGDAPQIIDRAGRSIILISRWPEPNGRFSRLRIFDLASRTVRTLAQGTDDVSQLNFSDDGRRVLFVSTSRFFNPGASGAAQAFVVDLDGATIPRQLTTDPDGLQSAVLAGNGHVAFGFTNAGRLIRFSLDVPGETTELIPRTPLCCGAYSPVAGSLFTVYGTGLYDSAGNPPAVSIDGKAISLVSSSPMQLSFVILGNSRTDRW